MGSTADTKRLESCINDLISVLALPAIWSGRGSVHILGTLLDVLLTMLRLDFAYARLGDAGDGPQIELVRVGDQRYSSVQPQQFGQALGPYLAGDQTASRCVVADPMGEGEVSIASFSLGLQDEVGVLIAGSRRTDFPTEVERLLLRVAANQAAIGLQEGRRSDEQKRIAEMLEQRVAERTKRLTSVNDELRRSEAYLAEAQRLSHTGSFGWKPSTGEINWSEETFRIFQFDRMTTPTIELILERVHPEDAASVKETIERASQEGKDFEHEYRLVMPDGAVKHVQVVAHGERDESGELEFVGAVMDVSDRKRAEEELRRSEALAEQRLRLVVDTTPAMINTCRPDGYLDYVNKGWLDYFGFSLETALDRADVMKISMPSKAEGLAGDWHPIIHPDDLARFTDHWKGTLASGKPAEQEARVRRFDGVYRWHLFRAVPLYDEAGLLSKWYISAFDIEDRKRAEVLLAGEKRLLEMIARGDSRALVLEAACLLVEELASGALSSILLLDPSANCLRHGAAPSLPITYTEAIDGAVIGPCVGSCGTAAYRAEPVFVCDIATDPLWADFRNLALAHGLRACWSAPILSSAGRVLGTFATYYREPCSPSQQERNVVERITHLVSIAIESEQAEETLRRSESYLAEAQRLTHTGSWAWRVAGGNATHLSEEWYRIYGFDPEKGLSAWEERVQRIDPEDRTKWQAVVDRAIAERSDYEVEARIHLPGGTVKYIRTLGHPVLSASGDLVQFVGSTMDITERKRADEALRRSEGYLAEAQRLTGTGSWAWNATDRRSVYWSQENYRLFGFDPKGGIPSDEAFYQRVHPDDRDRVRKEVFLESPNECSHFDVEFRIVLPGGAIKYVRSTGHPVRNQSGDLLEHVGTSVDVTERKRVDEERERLRQLQADLAHGSRVTTIGELTASVAHEVNQPIAAAITNANTCLRWLAGDTPNIEEARAAAMRIAKDGKRAGEIVSRIRQLFKKGTSQRELVDVNEIIREMTVLLRGETARYNIVLATDLAADLPQAMADRVQLQQVLMNLMLNSIEAMKDVDGTHELTIRSRRMQNEEVVVSVTDSGVGLPPQHTEQIFNAFFTTKPHGTGMGLRISRSIIESHGGRLWALDNSPRGASFYFNLPTKVETGE
jgi:PAS domain S-box-containing protein